MIGCSDQITAISFILHVLCALSSLLLLTYFHICFRVNWSAHEKHLLAHYQKKLHERPFHTKSFQTLHATAPVTHFPRTVTLFSGFNPERTQNLKIFNNSPTHSVKFGILHVSESAFFLFVVCV